MLRTTLVLCALVSTAGIAHALDPAQFGGGRCHEMAQRHDPSTLYVGRFAAEEDDGGQTSEVACFTDHGQCIRWIDRDSGEVAYDEVYQMSCHRGL